MTGANGFPTRGINKFVSKYIRNMPDLSGKFVVDVPCGDGRASSEFIKKGATVKPLDLYPEFMAVDGLAADVADLNEPLPVESNSVDYVICQEGIEHVQDQLGLLREFNRILKKNGRLLITTPNGSHARARLSWFLFETMYWKRMPESEIDSIWAPDKDSKKLYFGHIFLTGVQHLQTLATISGFKTEERLRTSVGNSSIIVGVLFYPVLMVMSFFTWGLYRRRRSHISQQKRDAVFWERTKLNLSPITLFCKNIFWVLRKDMDNDEIVEQLKASAFDPCR